MFIFGFLYIFIQNLEISFPWQVWNLELRQLVHCFQWEANVTAFSVIYGTYLMCVFIKGIALLILISQLLAGLSEKC